MRGLVAGAALTARLPIHDRTWKDSAAFEELKSRQSVMWGAGPYEPIVEITREIHAELVQAVAPQAGERLLDVATGTGAVALLAARAGAEVTGLDLAPDLIEVARRKAAAEGLDVEFTVGDAEALPYEDGAFDIVCSAIGRSLRPTTRPLPASWRASASRAAVSASRAGRRRAA